MFCNLTCSQFIQNRLILEQEACKIGNPGTGLFEGGYTALGATQCLYTAFVCAVL